MRNTLDISLAAILAARKDGVDLCGDRVGGPICEFTITPSILAAVRAHDARVLRGAVGEQEVGMACAASE